MSRSRLVDMLLRNNVVVLLWPILCAVVFAGRIATPYTFRINEQPPASDSDLTSLFPRTTFSKSFYPIWAPDHAEVSLDQSTVQLRLDNQSGCGIKSINKYLYGFFSAAIKLPANYSAGVVTTFYMSNSDVYPGHHDEFDFEFLGTLPGEPYTVQTNVYGNGRTEIGRERRFHLWFDPTADFHNYSILWTANHTVYFVDNVPVWEFINTGSLGPEYPQKQMSLFATIWDASNWATDGGRHKVNYTFQPFLAAYSELIVGGCTTYDTVATGNCPPITNHTVSQKLTRLQTHLLHWVESNFMIYDYCRDLKRYPDLMTIPECAEERDVQPAKPEILVPAPARSPATR